MYTANDETNIPTQKAKEKPHPRLFKALALRNRQTNASPSPPEGSHTPLRLKCSSSIGSQAPISLHLIFCIVKTAGFLRSPYPKALAARRNLPVSFRKKTLQKPTTGHYSSAGAARSSKKSPLQRRSPMFSPRSALLPRLHLQKFPLILSGYLSRHRLA